MRTIEQVNVLDLINEIKSVHLFEAYISIEEEKADELIQSLREKNIDVGYASWNHPDSLYVGDGKPTGKLAVLSLKW